MMHCFSYIFHCLFFRFFFCRLVTRKQKQHLIHQKSQERESFALTNKRQKGARSWSVVKMIVEKRLYPAMCLFVPLCPHPSSPDSIGRSQKYAASETKSQKEREFIMRERERETTSHRARLQVSVDWPGLLTFFFAGRFFGTFFGIYALRGIQAEFDIEKLDITRSSSTAKNTLLPSV